MEFVLAIGAMFGSFGDEVPQGWEAVRQALQTPKIDWVEYYKYVNYSRPTNRLQFAPVFVAPTMQWAVPNDDRWLTAYPPPGFPYWYPSYSYFPYPIQVEPAKATRAWLVDGFLCPPGYTAYGFPVEAVETAEVGKSE